jgi:small-conductance mechanosensitive channel
MPELTDFERELVRLILWMLGSGAAALTLSLFWRWVLIPFSRRTRTRLDARMAEAVDGKLPWVLISLGLYTGASLAFPGLESGVGGMGLYRQHRVWQILLGATYINLVLSITYLAYGGAKGLVDWYAEHIQNQTHSEVDSQVVLLFERFAKLVFLVIALTIIFDHFNISISGILAAGSIGALAVAFAARETLANMISGIVLMIDRPFKRGDRITLPSGEWGDVLEIGLRSTKVLSFTQQVVVLPNAEVAKSEIVNHSAPDQKVKIEHHLGVAYGSDMRKVKRIVFEILKAHPKILDFPPQQVYFMEFGDSSLNLAIFFWVPDYRNRWQVLDDVNMAIKDRFEAEGVEIPFPQRDIYIRRMATPAAD